MKRKLNGILTLFLVFVVQLTFAQQKTVTGTVIDEDGLPMPGTTILVRGTNVGTQTNFDGNYSVQATQGQVLVFSFVGYQSQSITVGAANTINVTLGADAAALDEVVIVGFGQRDENKVIQTISTITEDALDDIPAQSPQDLLQGQASGVSITNASGVLGARSSVRIRGVNSLTGGAQPLFVVDGVPLDDSNQTFALGGGGLNPLSSINPESIASMTILKDAAATAIYGSRGSNGVILITTKQGRKGQAPQITFESFTQISNATDLPTVLDNQQYGQFFADVRRLRFGDPVNNAVDLRDFRSPQRPNGFGDYTGEGFDWLGAAFRTGYTYTQNLSVRGGSDNSTYYLGVNHTDAEGFIFGNALTTTGVRLNLNTDISDNIRVGANLNANISSNDRVGEENNVTAVFSAAMLIRPNAVPTNAAGDYIPSGQTGQNFIGVEALNTSLVNSTRLIGNVFAEIDFLNDQFTYRVSLGGDKRWDESIFRNSTIFTPGGSANNAIGQVEALVMNQTLNWKNTFGRHNLSALLGNTYEETNIRFLQASSTNFLSDALPNVGSGANPAVTSSTTSASSLIGYFAQLGYDFDGKYLLEGSIRRDGSSRFGEDNRFGTFYAAAAGWNVHREAFMDNSIFNRLAVRASYGTTGNDRIGNFTARATYGSGDYNGNPGLVATGPALPGLQWEETKGLDLGIKTGILNDRVTLNVNYYNKTTSNLLIPVPTPFTAGYASVTQNAGELQNSGFEFDLGVTPVSNETFTWNVNFNLSTIKNEVLSLPGAALDVDGRAFIQGTAVQRAVVGESANSFYLIRYLGVNPETGNAEWLDRNDVATTTPTPNDRKIVGDANPDFYGGFRSNMTWKNFDLSALFNFSYGNNILIDQTRFSGNPNFIGSFNLYESATNYWTPDNRNAYAPNPASATWGTFANIGSTLQMYDGSYLRLKNVTLGYTLPQDFLGVNGIFSGVRIYATGTNLVTFKGSDLDGIDPEVTDSTNPLALGQSFFVAPQQKSYIVGVKLNF